MMIKVTEANMVKKLYKKFLPKYFDNVKGTCKITIYLLLETKILLISKRFDLEIIAIDIDNIENT